MTLHRVVPLLFAWLLAAPITLAAQTADTVRGVVYDSLLKAPLQGALVLGSVPGQEQVAQATTDANGQFLLVAPGRIERLTVFHEELEQLGLALDARRGAEDMRWTPRLGVPSLATLWLRLCHRPIPATGEQPAIVYGTLRLADGSTRVAGAAVTLGWDPQVYTDERNRRGKASLPPATTALVRSDAQGEFVFCGVPDAGQYGIVARGSGLTSSDVLLLADGRPVRRVELVLGDSTRRATVIGRIFDEAGNPVSTATVTIDGVAGEVITGDDGRFGVRDVPLGTRMLSARKVGFLPAVVPTGVLEASDLQPAREQRVSMQRGTTLEGVRVTARRTLNRESVEFNRRVLLGQGNFLTGRKLAAFPRLDAALQTMPGLMIGRTDNGPDFVILGRQQQLKVGDNKSIRSFGRCQATVYTDGVLEDPRFLSMPSIEGLAAVEVHPQPDFAPIRYRPINGGNCSVVLLWTKAFLSR